MKRLLLIGQAPAAQGDLTKALEGSLLMAKMCELFGCTWREYITQTERLNVLPYHPGRRGKGDLFPLGQAREAAAMIKPRLKGRRVLFIGKATATVFGVKAAPCEWEVYVEDGLAFQFAILPHLSGINRWWNRPGNQQLARAFMRDCWAERKEAS